MSFPLSMQARDIEILRAQMAIFVQRVVLHNTNRFSDYFDMLVLLEWGNYMRGYDNAMS